MDQDISDCQQTATPSGRVIHKTEFIRIKSESIRINYDFFTDFKGLLTDFSGLIIADYPVSFGLHNGSLRIIRLLS